ncbi:hypothetical protein Purlil1_13070 [Purpureocillium lilacinum]|uniref:GRF zinc finger domain-containing protein n=1 Tax=Purpureocillium lilacinum TaxID=33203 RepID=A0ABR0BF37_PURLI|nr:hypothetical protein Purlil1_13070 [Purpureocillium lilacinum]
METPTKTRAHLWSRIDGVTKWNGRLYCPCGLEMRKNRSQDERREFLYYGCRKPFAEQCKRKVEPTEVEQVVALVPERERVEPSTPRGQSTIPQYFHRIPKGDSNTGTPDAGSHSRRVVGLPTPVETPSRSAVALGRRSAEYHSKTRGTNGSASGGKRACSPGVVGGDVEESPSRRRQKRIMDSRARGGNGSGFARSLRELRDRAGGRSEARGDAVSVSTGEHLEGNSSRVEGQRLRRQGRDGTANASGSMNGNPPDGAMT